MPEQFTNGAQVTVSSPISNSATSVTVSGAVSGTPPMPATGTFRVRNLRTGELVKVVGVSGFVWDITGGRGDGSSTAAAMNAGDTLEQDLTVEAMAAAFLRADIATAAVVQAQGFQASGVGHFTTPGRWLGVLSVQGPPTSGTYSTGDHGFDSKGAQWYCAAGGTPGTWLYVGGGPYHAEAHQSTNQVVANSTVSILTCDMADSNPNGDYNAVTSRYTCAVPGTYRVGGLATWLTPGVKVNPLYIAAYKNASEARRGQQIAPASGDVNPAILLSAPVACLAGDVLDVRVFQVAGTNYNTSAGAATVWSSYALIQS